MTDLAATVRRLSGASRRTWRDAYSAVDWPEALDPTRAWYTSPQLVSLWGTERWEALSEEQRRRLSFWEAVSFFSLNVHGERMLMAGLATRLYSPGLESVAEYLHHFLDEENRHSVWFATFCLRYGGRVYPDRTLAFPSDGAPGQEDVVFFARVALFEEIVDHFNRAMAGDERLAPVVRRIHALHHTDEARHLVFGRRIVEELWRRHAPGWPAPTVRGVHDHLTGFLSATLRLLCSADAYRDAGLANPAGLARWARDDPTLRHRRDDLTGACLEPYVRIGVLPTTALGPRPPAGPRVDARGSLRRWITERNPGLLPEALDDGTPLVEARYLTSLQLPELLLFLEELTGRPIDPRAVRAGSFRDIETICATFFDGTGDA